MSKSTSCAQPGRAKYQHLVEHLRGRIKAGAVPQKQRLTTFSELQAEFAVTPGTVNRALIALEQEGLIERRRGSGIYVAQNRKKPLRSGFIGVAGFGFQYGGPSTYWASILAGMREGAANAQAELVLLDYKSPRGLEKVDGLLLCDWTGKKTLPKIPPPLPCVSLLVPVEGMASVHADDYGAMRTSMEYLFSLGHRRIAYLIGGDATVSMLRRAAYQDALKETGIDVKPNWQRELPPRHGGKHSAYGTTFIENGREAMQSWLAEDWKQQGFTALLAHNDEVAIGAIEALQESGIQVPRDVSVIGFDGLEIGQYFTPRLTTSVVPLHEIGVRATEMLREQIQADDVMATQCVLAAELRIGQSTAPIVTSP